MIWSVTVHVDGQPILTISPNELAGKADLTEADEQAIRDAGEHLLAFIGPADPQQYLPGGY